MPWCEMCSKYWSNPSVRDDGTCPQCGTTIAQARSDTKTKPAPRAPWHFKLLLVALVVYLAFRLYQLIAWVAVRVA